MFWRIKTWRKQHRSTGYLCYLDYFNFFIFYLSQQRPCSGILSARLCVKHIASRKSQLQTSRILVWSITSANLVQRSSFVLALTQISNEKSERCSYIYYITFFEKDLVFTISELDLLRKLSTSVMKWKTMQLELWITWFSIWKYQSNNISRTFLHWHKYPTPMQHPADFMRNI